VTASRDNTIRVWDIESRQCIKILGGHTSLITCLQLNECFIVSGSFDQSIRIWDYKEFNIIQVISTGRHITSVSFFENILAVGCRDGFIVIVNLESNDKFEFVGHGSMVKNLLLVTRDILLSASCRSGKVKFWKLNPFQLIKALDTMNFVADLTYKGNGIILVLCENGSIKLIDVSTSTFVKDSTTIVPVYVEDGLFTCADVRESTLVRGNSKGDLILYFSF
jgi:WD40 repeat protein